MIGDRLDSDILFGKNGNMATLAVLTGCVSAAELVSVCGTRGGCPPPSLNPL